ncbi:dephospho-CoA kinase domain-containing protein-like [Xenia sp. Carnegie-2017]|nr:dephospho-CoA kinase domain-containing protein-like [Xenia sp. Carnegie-2017]XP_046841311.1 dephospho-CoA kinase domain-containing protein-like [Xenia sp. Carnegie-2017]
MFLVGLTGGIASGKSYVASMLNEKNCKIIDMDKIAREVVEPGRPAWKRILKNFGKDILMLNGEINRTLLGEIIFADENKRRILNRCTHPAIRKAVFFRLLKLFFQGHRFVILETPLLFESGIIASFMHKIIVVYCDPDT